MATEGDAHAAPSTAPSHTSTAPSHTSTAPGLTSTGQGLTSTGQGHTSTDLTRDTPPGAPVGIAPPATSTFLGAGPGLVHVRTWPAADVQPDLRPNSPASSRPPSRAATAPDPAARPVLFCCHGLGDSGEVFGPLAEGLGRRWTVVAPDAPGHGFTPARPGLRVRLADHTTALRPVLDGLPRLIGAHGPVVILGHSMGALTAADLAALRPDVVAHLALEEPLLATRSSGRSAVRRLVNERQMLVWIRRLRHASHEELADLARELVPHWPETERLPWARSKREMSLRPFALPLDWGDPLSERLTRTSCPVTLLRGTAGSDVVSDADADLLARAAPGRFRLVTLPGGHNLRREAAAPFQQAVAEVLESVAAR